MSTRTVLVFSDRKNDKIEYGIPIYKHWDGYLSNILHLLRCYLWVNKSRLQDIEYLSAGFIRYCENYERYEYVPDRFKEEKNFMASDPYIGFGLFQTEIKNSILDGWEDYYYKITPDMVYVYNGSDVKKMYEISIEKLLEMPEEYSFYEDLEKKIFSEFYGDDYI